MSYRENIATQINSAGGRRLGHKIAKQSLRLNLPVSAIHESTGIPRQTIYNWFKDGTISDKYKDTALRLLEVLESCDDYRAAYAALMKRKIAA